MKLITLIENTTCSPDLACEHGLSLYLETGSHRILFDMGQSRAFTDNAKKLGIDLSRVDFAILSHGHYDHGGGMETFFRCNQSAPLYLSRHAFEPHFNAAGKDIGLREVASHDRLIFTQGLTQLAPGITLYTVSFLPTDTAGMTACDGQPEDFRHEQYLLLEEDDKRILLSGCSHKGIVAIAEYFRPDILIGGFHFMKTEDEALLAEAAHRLLALDCTFYTGHCTGQKQYDFLKTIMGNRLNAISTGTILEL